MEAWVDLEHVNVLILWRDPLIRAALLRQLGRSAQAQGTAAQLQRLKRIPQRDLSVGRR